jgi:hypothetical protein
MKLYCNITDEIDGHKTLCCFCMLQVESIIMLPVYLLLIARSADVVCH